MGKVNVFQASVLTILTLTTAILRSVAGQANVVSGSKAEHTACMRAAVQLPEIEWKQPLPSQYVSVEWTYGNITCNSMRTCFPYMDGSDEPLEPQMVPLEVQEGVRVNFYAGKNMDVNFTIQPFWVSQESYVNCSIDGGVPVVSNPQEGLFELSSQFLKSGSNYFVVNTPDHMFKCKYGLKVNITVKPEKCKGLGQPVKCWDKGKCVTSPGEPTYTCSCCPGYAGRYCDDIDACVSKPCQNGATCVDEPNDVTGMKFFCHCPHGYLGDFCEYYVDNLCDIHPCKNGATCQKNGISYQCSCPSGFTGTHCEVNIDECFSSPCKNGTCIDDLNGYRCNCFPGFGGDQCEKEYNECQSNPCRNGGVCVDLMDAYKCHCGDGYTDKDCSTKIDLCNPNPCRNALECVDHGNTRSCTCKPGFTGRECEININECQSSPCINGGLCHDEVAAYRCICHPPFTGLHCERHRNLNDDKDVKKSANSVYHGHFYHNPHINNLYIVAGTLAGALLLALLVLMGCYCRINETYRKLGLGKKGYHRQMDEGLQHAVDVSSIHGSRPSADAIMSASGGSYHENSMNAPLIHSLRPKRI